MFASRAEEYCVLIFADSAQFDGALRTALTDPAFADVAFDQAEGTVLAIPTRLLDRLNGVEFVVREVGPLASLDLEQD